MNRATYNSFECLQTFLLLATLNSCCTVAFGDPSCHPELSRLVSVQGHVESSSSQSHQWQSAQLGQGYCGEDRLRTGDSSRAVLSMDQDRATFLALDQQTLLSFVKNADRIMLSVERGQVHVRSHTPTRFDISTPFVNAGIEGTEFLIRTDERTVEISVFEGKVRAFNAQGEIMVGKGQRAWTPAGGAPTLKQVDMTPNDAVRWTLYYPPLIDFAALSSSAWGPRIAEAGRHYAQGDIIGALDSLRTLDASRTDVDLLVIQAGLLLTVGQVDGAEALIHRAESQSSNHDQAILHALRAIIALSKNDKEQARQWADMAVSANPRSAAPYVALSYVEQAFFRIDAARQAIEKALSSSPGNALLHCRHAELLTSQGELESARSSAEKALALNPALSRTQVVLGFIQLMEADIATARARFEHAITLDSSDPLAYFGLGLASIYNGDLARGIEYLEIAASLDPNDALTRSYLGKAYYEQNRLALAELQLQLAKQQDPMDPTPYHYEAIMQQTSNRPTQALDAMREAMRRNDNRAVYRSRLLLDEDLAARSASLARIYNDLGFEKLAYDEASLSVLHDPGNFSAHRFLADTYASMPRHEMARVSEVLQMQLWQPRNLALLQPQLNQSYLGILQTGGSQNASFREYNPLFMRDGAYFQTSGLVASNSTFSDDAVVNYQQGRAGFSFGQYHYQTQGFRPNADLTQNVYDGMLQVALTPDTRLQAEMRRQENQRGDVFLHEQANLTRRENDNSDTWRLGMRHVFSPASAMIANLTKIDHYNNGFDFPFATFVSDDAYSSEIQHLYRTDQANYVNGFSYYQAEQHCHDRSYILLPGLSLCPEARTDIANGKVYNYSTFRFPENIYWTLGISVDYLKNAYVDEKTFNPKWGMTWQADVDTTLRFAAFKTTKHSLINNQTIEPTQIAGFNQLFDDPDSTQAWRLGAGIDHRFSKSVTLGYEWSQRRLQQPYSKRVATDDSTTVLYQRLQRAYWNVMLHDHVVASMDYQYSNMDAMEAKDLVTHKVPVNLAFFHVDGLSANLRTTFYHQQGRYALSPTAYEEKQSSFFTLDLSAHYRLPNRHGKVSLGILNVLDRKFLYTDFDSEHPTLFPERIFYSNLVFSF